MKSLIKVEQEEAKGLKSVSADNVSLKTQDIKKRSFVEGEFIGEDGKQRAFNAAEFLIKFEEDGEWKERYLKLEESCLLIYKHKNV